MCVCVNMCVTLPVCLCPCLCLCLFRSPAVFLPAGLRGCARLSTCLLLMRPTMFLSLSFNIFTHVLVRWLPSESLHLRRFTRLTPVCNEHSLSCWDNPLSLLRPLLRYPLVALVTIYTPSQCRTPLRIWRGSQKRYSLRWIMCALYFNYDCTRGS